MFQVIKLIDLIATLGNPDAWFVRDYDEQGQYFYTVADGLRQADQSEPFWNNPVRVLWNKEHTVAIAHKAVPANVEPDRKVLFLMHQSEVHVK